MKHRIVWLAVVLVLTNPDIAHAAPPPDSDSIVTLQAENDALSGTDRNYTNGIRLSWTSPTGVVPGPLAAIGQALFGPGQQRLSLGLSQILFTPRNTQIVPPDPKDRPYAGLLMGSITLIHDTDTARTLVAFDLGVIGPAALGQQMQNGFHDAIGEHDNRGWGSQLPNQPTFELLAGRLWRVPFAAPGPLALDLLPQVSAGAGTWRVYGLAGGQARLGHGLNADFGAPASTRAWTERMPMSRPVRWSGICLPVWMARPLDGMKRWMASPSERPTTSAARPSWGTYRPGWW